MIQHHSLYAAARRARQGGQIKARAYNVISPVKRVTVASKSVYTLPVVGGPVSGSTYKFSPGLSSFVVIYGGAVYRYQLQNGAYRYVIERKPKAVSL